VFKQKARKTSLPLREIKKSVWAWIFVQNKDGPYPAPAWSSLWGGHPAPAGAVSPEKGAQPFPLPLGRTALRVTPRPGECPP